MTLQEDVNYLFFPKAIASSHFLLGLMPIEGSAVCTRNFILFVPDDRKEFGNQFVKSMTFGAVKEGADTPTMLSNLVNAPGMTVEGLEQSLIQFLQQNGKASYIIHIPDWSSFVNKTGLFGQTRLIKDENKRNWLAFVIKGKGGKKRMKAFYDQFS